jgi:hypothetical protein
MRVEIDTKVNGKMTKEMGKAFAIIIMEIYMMGNGKMIIRLEKEFKVMQLMGENIKEVF